ncbi:polysaccharide deacetylase family protein [Bacillus sp. V59.32b]|uniref:polysaccharide deacetylase family protein n=1 Tax=Bacillus sp. V59.32b TaxID=1758642 RepID=UPI00135C7E96|nr:polysaccharide deacetylase family protein [Bacillus sp. V59.32b]
MPVYFGKLLELISIERKSEQSFLRVRLSFEQEVDLLWEIDDYTAESLEAMTVFEDHFKYRLSFQGSWDQAKQEYISFLTKTHRDRSEKIYFSCSEKYVEGLNFIRSIESINEIHALPFLPVDQPADEPEQVKEIKPVTVRYNPKLTWAAITIISVISTILLGYSVLSNKDEIALAQKSSLKDITEQASVKQKEKESVTGREQAESGIPTVTLDQSVNYNIPKGTVALTFDDGPTKHTKEIVDVLKKYEVGGTFFFAGFNVEKFPDHVQYVNSNGYSIGSHSMTHTNFAEIPYEEQQNELTQINQLIEGLIDEPVVLFRPPYGANNDHTVELMKKHDNKMVLWNKDTEDWKGHDADVIFDYVESSKASGSIILLHESQEVIDALPRIIEYMQEQNLEIVNLQ